MATALFVIDIQNDLATDPETRIPHSERIKVAGEKILSAARAVKGTPQAGPSTIVFVQHEEKPESGPLVRGSEPWQLVFEPHPGASTERLVAKWTRTSHD
jgi:nicotinamidase-related amidase